MAFLYDPKELVRCSQDHRKDEPTDFRAYQS